jgi:hypothetical protein
VVSARDSDTFFFLSPLKNSFERMEERERESSLSLKRSDFSQTKEKKRDRKKKQTQRKEENFFPTRKRKLTESYSLYHSFVRKTSSGPQPADMYGKFTWKIENFSEISKRELRSKCFEVGGYKWYILVYPQGCDVHNHLSLFLCVADYDKLLPGWSHFAQFTIAVVNKDPKKSKYSDTLHRFCKKEHDWGWKKFMELGKVLDGFTVADTLVIKAQVQVIHEKIARPFRCLDPQYRRELVRVYLTNVEVRFFYFCFSFVLLFARMNVLSHKHGGNDNIAETQSKQRNIFLRSEEINSIRAFLVLSNS